MATGTMWPMARTSDRLRVVLVAVTAVLQTVAVPFTTWALGPGAHTREISEADTSPVTPADYSFYVWGLVYVGCLALAGYQVLPSQRERRVHRRTGWWLAGGFLANAVSVLIFGTGVIWLAQILLVILVVCWSSPPGLPGGRASATTAEEILLRLPVMIYSGGRPW